MHAREAVPLGTLAVLAGVAGIGIWMAEFIVPGFSGPPWQTVVSIVGIAFVVGIVGRPSAQLDPRSLPVSTEPDAQPRRPLRNVVHDGLTGGAAAQPAFNPQNVANATYGAADKEMDRTAPL